MHSGTHDETAQILARLGEQGIVQALDQVGVLHITSQELGVLHTEGSQVCSSCRLELCSFVIWVEALSSLISTVPAQGFGLSLCWTQTLSAGR